MNQPTVHELLAEKVRILQAIAANSETQVRFLQRENPKGMQRLLDERGVLINELETVSQKLKAFKGWKERPEFRTLVQAIEAKQGEITDYSKRALALAKEERDRVAEDLRRIRSMKKAKNSYTMAGMPTQAWAVNRKG